MRKQLRAGFEIVDSAAFRPVLRAGRQVVWRRKAVYRVPLFAYRNALKELARRP